MKSTLLRSVAGLAMTTALCAPGMALAQQQGQPDPNVTVQDRPRPDYDPLGIRAGSFFIFPSLTVQGGYDDNVYATNDDEEDDLFAVVAPEVLVQSNWSRHSLNVRVGAESGLYREEDNNNYFDFFTNANGRLDITRDNILSGGVELSRLHEGRADPDSAGAEEDVTEYWRGSTRLDYRRNFNRVFAIIGGDFQRLDFEDTGDQNEDDRDRNQYRARARVGYEISPRFAGFVEGTYDVRRYDETPDDEGFDRDSQGASARGGVEIDITSILFGEVAVGYTRREYDDGDLDTVDGVGFGGTLTWNVTPLTSIIFEAIGEVQETTVDFEGETASANFQKRAGVDVTHELLRNVLLNANAAYTRDDFEGTERSDDSIDLGAGVTYLLNRNLSLNATYTFTTRSSDDDDEEFDRNVVLVGITARL